jgi:carboxypeptidase family protein
MSKTGLLTLLLLAVIATASLIFWPSSADGTLGFEADPAESVSLGAIEEGAQGAEPEVFNSAPDVRVETEGVSTPSNPGKFLPAYKGENGLTVFVVDRETQGGVAHADVYALDPREFSLPSDSVESKGLTWILHEYGHHYQTGADGKTRIVKPSPGGMIYAELDGRSGLRRGLQAEGNQVNVEIYTVRPFEVKVLDAEGKAVAKVPVILGFVSEGSFQHILTRSTGSDGILSFSDLFPYLDGAQEIDALFVELGIPVSPLNAADLQRTILSEKILQSGRLTLTMPPVGQVRVSMIDGLGKALPMVGTIALRPTQKIDGQFQLNSRKRETTNGTAEFRFVGLGAPLRAAYYLQGRGAPTSVTFFGPNSAGAWAEANIVYSDKADLTGVILDPEGNLLKNQTIGYSESISFEIGHSQSRSGTRTDDHGRFRLELHKHPPEKKVSKHLIQFTLEMESLGKCSAEFELPNSVPPGPYDLGNITLRPEPILLEGHVYTQTGEPVADARIQLSTPMDPGTKSPRYNSPRSQSTKTDQTGAFQLQSLPPKANNFFLWISADGFDTLHQEVTLNTSGLEFRLTEAAHLQGYLQFDEGMEGKGISIQLLNDTQALRAKIIPDSNSSLLRFSFESHANVSTVLEIKTELGEVIYRSGTLILPSGEVSRPPDLQPLDLRGVLHAFTIQVQNARGLPATASITMDSPNGFTQSRNVKGELTLLAVEPIPRIEIQAKRSATQVLLQVISDQIVTLEDGLAVEVQIPAELVGYKDCELKMGATLMGGKNKHNMSDATGFDASGRARLFIPQLGEYKIWIHATPGQKNFWGTAFLGRFPATIHSHGQVISIDLDLGAAKQEIDKMLDKN